MKQLLETLRKLDGKKFIKESVDPADIKDLLAQYENGDIEYSDFQKGMEKLEYTDYSMRQGENGFPDRRDDMAWDREKADWDALDQYDRYDDDYEDEDNYQDEDEYQEESVENNTEDDEEPQDDDVQSLKDTIEQFENGDIEYNDLLDFIHNFGSDDTEFQDDDYQDDETTSNFEESLSKPKCNSCPNLNESQCMQECGGDAPTMAPSLQKQDDQVSMSVNMSGSGSGGIKDILNILRNIENGGEHGEHDGAMMIIDDEPEFEDFANAPDEKYSSLKDIIRSGDDLHKSKHSYSDKPYHGDNPMAVKEKLESLYNFVKSR
jgi:DNA-directed RNA polymerase subunit delta